MKDDGAKVLAQLLHENRTITEVRLRGHNIKDDGGMALADVLRAGSPLLVLDLENNAMGLETASMLTQIMKMDADKLPLTSLKLSGNFKGETVLGNKKAFKSRTQILNELKNAGGARVSGIGTA